MNPLDDCPLSSGYAAIATRSTPGTLARAALASSQAASGCGLRLNTSTSSTPSAVNPIG
jgi:hypothetical protein